MSTKSDVLLEQSISKALASIRGSAALLGPLASSSSASKPIPAVPEGLRSIIATLLKSIRHTTTALSLAFKPPITVPAAIQQLDKISDEFARTVSCVIGSAAHGSYSILVDEWREGVEAIGVELVRLIQTLRDGPTTGTGSVSTSPTATQISIDENPYLAHTGMVWDAVDRLTDLSWTEVEAVQKRIKGQRAIIDDAWTEFKEFLAEQDGVDDDGSDGSDDEDDLDDLGDDDDDEWGELEKAMGGSKLNKEERSRAESAKTILGLHQVLHASIPRFILPSSSTRSDPNFRQLADKSSSIVAAFDTAIAAMYPIQDEKEIELALSDLEAKSRGLIGAVETMLQQVEDVEQRDNQKVKLDNFTQRWLDRLEAEKKTWEERKLSLKSLRDALP